MNVGEFKKLLETVPDDMLVLTTTNHGTLVRAMQIGTIEVIPTYQNKNLLPGNEWRVPVNANDEREAERVRHFMVS